MFKRFLLLGTAILATNAVAGAAVVAVPALAGAASAAPSVQMAQAQTAQQAPKPVTKADFTKNVDARFAALDTNKDGAIDKSEVAAAQSRTLQRAAVTQQQRLETEFKKLDTNKDNQLSLAEFKAAAPGIRAEQTPDQMLAALDANKDGKISAAEYRGPQLASFDRTDANKDGSVSPQEVQAARANRR